jgi:integrase
MIEELKRKKGSVFRVSIYGADGNRKTKVFPNKTLAKEWERRILRERDEQEATGLVVQDSVTFDEFVDRWYKEKVVIRLSDSTRTGYERVLKKHLMPIFSMMRLRDIRVDHANRLVAKLKTAGHAPKGINNILGVLLTIMNDAVEWQCLARNPLFRYKPVKEPEQHFDYWTAPEIQQFLNATNADPLQALYIVALNTGMRRGEICALKWDRVDFIRNQLIVSRTLGRFGLSETTKTGRKRYVPINPVVKDVLQKLMREQRGEFVFCDKSGVQMDAHQPLSGFPKIAKESRFLASHSLPRFKAYVRFALHDERRKHL